MAKVVALFECLNTGSKVALCQNMLGGFYIDRLDYKGLYLAGATKPINSVTLMVLSDKRLYRVVKSPKSIYHVFHICLCPACEKVGGRYFDHSQASFNGHLRFVKNEWLFTFPVLENKN